MTYTIKWIVFSIFHTNKKKPPSWAGEHGMHGITCTNGSRNGATETTRDEVTGDNHISQRNVGLLDYFRLSRKTRNRNRNHRDFIQSTTPIPSSTRDDNRMSGPFRSRTRPCRLRIFQRNDGCSACPHCRPTCRCDCENCMRPLRDPNHACASELLSLAWPAS